MYDFRGRVALVTGASSGIGRAVAQLYAQNGAKVVVSDVNDEGGAETVRLIEQAGGEAAYFHADVSDPQACEALVQFALDRYGRLDFACNNAGIAGESNPTGSYSIEGWKKVIDINLNGVFYCMRYEIPAMLKNGGGSIVNMASILGQVGFANAPAYVTAKHGLIGLTRNAAIEYAKSNIRVNSIGPAFIKTPLLAPLESDPNLMNMIVALHPIGRLGQPEEVAELVMWLSSEKASFVTGSYYAVDGGYLAQ
ncbi:MAG: SDR family oxidoreductase [Anaerolineales bacterium]|nr:SDR family oxidoreductase [Anaerolineales bacterium]MCS7249192.1 SDR family oxidoreductase [Anaerolineales bacterium]MDW8163005.1 SDR family oxidoreductase [Anaerolineales bacterium]MDW8447509.1 SDR family oxidoreductase [Anaerolineales bacterium]